MPEAFLSSAGELVIIAPAPSDEKMRELREKFNAGPGAGENAVIIDKDTIQAALAEAG